MSLRWTPMAVTHVQSVGAQGRLRVLARRSWRGFRENGEQKRVEQGDFRTAGRHGVAHAERPAAPRGFA